MSILQQIKTAKNLQVLITELDAAILNLTGTTSKDVASIVKEEAPTRGDLILEYLKSKNAFEKKEAIKALEALSGVLDQVEELEISVAIVPSESFVTGIHSWVYKNVGNNVVVNMKRNPSLVGGATITYKGKYSDYSLAKNLDQYFDQVKKAKKI
jgi:F0F1-type ATP synthase delta subunit